MNNKVDITHITNYNKIFKYNKVSYQAIIYVIKKFKKYYDSRKIKMLKLHLKKNIQKDELYKFDELDFKTKNSLSKKINFNRKV